MRCANATHKTCGKSRSSALGTADFGRLAAVFFSGAWVAKAGMPEDAHKLYTSSRAEVKAVADSYEA